MATELTALRLLRERTCVPVLQVLAVHTSRELCDADCFFMEHVDGEDLDVVSDRWPQTDVDVCEQQVGTLTREVNRIRGPGVGRLFEPVGATWRPTFLRMLDDVIDDGERRRVDLGCSTGVLQAIAVAGAPALDEVTEPRLAAWDLWPGNCRVRDGRVVAVVDHERAFYDDPLAEFGFAGWRRDGGVTPRPSSAATDGRRPRRQRSRAGGSTTCTWRWCSSSRRRTGDRSTDSRPTGRAPGSRTACVDWDSKLNLPSACGSRHRWPVHVAPVGLPD